MKVKFFSLLIFGIAVSSCDIIEEPYIKPVDDNGNNDEVVQKVLLEEFTGHQCPNCPVAASQAADLHEYYGDRFVIIAYHAGWFARTTADFPTEYRTAIGEEFNTHFQVTSYPKGMINRRYENGMILLNPIDWGSSIENIIQNEPKLKFTLTKNLNPENRSLSVNIEVKALSEVNPISVCVFITESNLVSPQKIAVSDEYPNGIIPDYIHNHVFRGSLNGAWGTPVFEHGAGVNHSENVSVNGILSDNWLLDNIAIVYFAYENDTGNILQVDEVSLM